jgi:hypothetical protein
MPDFTRKEPVTNRPAPEPTVQQRTLALLARLAPLDGYNPTPLPDVRLLRSNRPLARAPVLYEPGIVIVCQGRKRGFFGSLCTRSAVVFALYLRISRAR